MGDLRRPKSQRLRKPAASDSEVAWKADGQVVGNLSLATDDEQPTSLIASLIRLRSRPFDVCQTGHVAAAHEHARPSVDPSAQTWKACWSR